ncbi:hypothetical protein WOLCODRAFT_153941 [Wolfiporia cocos MD-104 SS10]|uniref:Uncharacterized protein n=1 Tax=Wolfiporia cocos (strain MD-104) TaxID=742152 RepID=A0A2H3JPR4_WOLCO|nr:hypothetical protein WOLCODRAFT_153941 [Wolfiporia cocos MD-104 SS10]
MACSQLVQKERLCLYDLWHNVNAELQSLRDPSSRIDTAPRTHPHPGYVRTRLFIFRRPRRMMQPIKNMSDCSRLWPVLAPQVIPCMSAVRKSTLLTTIMMNPSSRAKRREKQHMTTPRGGTAGGRGPILSDAAKQPRGRAGLRAFPEHSGGVREASRPHCYRSGTRRTHTQIPGVHG